MQYLLCTQLDISAWDCESALDCMQFRQLQYRSGDSQDSLYITYDRLCRSLCRMDKLEYFNVQCSPPVARLPGYFCFLTSPSPISALTFNCLTIQVVLRAGWTHQIAHDLLQDQNSKLGTYATKRGGIIVWPCFDAISWLWHRVPRAGYVSI